MPALMSPSSTRVSSTAAGSPLVELGDRSVGLILIQDQPQSRCLSEVEGEPVAAQQVSADAD